MTNYKNRTVGVVGMGRTGLSVARYLANQGARVLAYDRKPFEEFGESDRAEWLALENVERRTGHEKENALDGVDLLVLSPGVPPEIPPVARQREKGIPVWSEIELASQALREPILAIGGTNGKSTTTTLLGNLLKAAGWNPFVGGNLGTPLIEAVGEDYDQYVVEVSSFQMEATDMFRPHVAVLLNITPDHLDRYPSIHEYARAKAAMFRRMLPDDIAIVNGDDPQVARVLPNGPQIWKWSFKEPVALGAWADAEGLHFSTPAAVFMLRREEIALKGRHNEENVMAAVLAALTAGATPANIRIVLEHARPLPHRVEFVREVRGVSYFDDSKGTNIGAVATALQGFTQPVVLIAGGVDKGGDYHEIDAVVREHARAVIVIGEAADRIADAWGELVTVRKAKTMDEAVRKAAAAARPGDVVLLSPACSSFDMFRNYHERGLAFQAAVQAIEP